MMIIGITGTLGAGKTTIVEFLKKEGFKHHSVRDFIVEEIKRRGMPVDRDSMVVVANDLRKGSPSAIVDAIYDKAKDEGGDSIIESIRATGEADSLKEKDEFYLFSVDADRKIRYERITGRKSVTDHISFDEFVENEEIGRPNKVG